MMQVLESIKSVDQEAILLVDDDDDEEVTPEFEMLLYGMEILMTLCEHDLPTEENSTTAMAVNASKIGHLFTEILLKDVDNLNVILKYLMGHHFYLRYYSCQLLKKILQNGLERARNLIVKGRGCSTIVALLEEPRKEAIRNEGIILLMLMLQENTISNRSTDDNNLQRRDIVVKLQDDEEIDIQKILTFENVFERVLAILLKELEEDEESVIVIDCLDLLILLLSGNRSTQLYFQETQALKTLFQVFLKRAKIQKNRMFLLIFSYFSGSPLFEKTEFMAILFAGLKDPNFDYAWKRVAMDFILNMVKLNANSLNYYISDDDKESLFVWILKESLCGSDVMSWTNLCHQVISACISNGTVFEEMPHLGLIEKTFLEGPAVKGDVNKFIIASLYICQLILQSSSKTSSNYTMTLLKKECADGDLTLDFLVHLYEKVGSRYDLSAQQMILIQQHILMVLFAISLQRETRQFFYSSIYIQMILDSFRYLQRKLYTSCGTVSISCLDISLTAFLLVHIYDQIEANAPNEGYFTGKRLRELSQPYNQFLKGVKKAQFRFGIPEFLQNVFEREFETKFKPEEVTSSNISMLNQNTMTLLDSSSASPVDSHLPLPQKPDANIIPIANVTTSFTVPSSTHMTPTVLITPVEFLSDEFQSVPIQESPNNAAPSLFGQISSKVAQFVAPYPLPLEKQVDKGTRQTEMIESTATSTKQTENVKKQLDARAQFEYRTESFKMPSCSTENFKVISITAEDSEVLATIPEGEQAETQVHQYVNDHYNDPILHPTRSVIDAGTFLEIFEEKASEIKEKNSSEMNLLVEAYSNPHNINFTTFSPNHHPGEVSIEPFQTSVAVPMANYPEPMTLSQSESPMSFSVLHTGFPVPVAPAVSSPVAISEMKPVRKTSLSGSTACRRRMYHTDLYATSTNIRQEGNNYGDQANYQQHIQFHPQNIQVHHNQLCPSYNTSPSPYISHPQQTHQPLMTGFFVPTCNQTSEQINQTNVVSNYSFGVAEPAQQPQLYPPQLSYPPPT